MNIDSKKNICFISLIFCFLFNSQLSLAVPRIGDFVQSLQNNFLSEENINKASDILEQALQYGSVFYSEFSAYQNEAQGAIQLDEEQELHYASAIACSIASDHATEYLDKLSDKAKRIHQERESYLIAQGWIPLPTSEELTISNAGYYGVAYYKINKEDGHNTATVLVAHRGTCFDKLNNIISDFEIIERKTPLILEGSFYYLNALLNNNFYSKSDYNESTTIEGVPVTKIIHVGFSLGGYIASVNALTSNFPETYAVTFDAPGSDYLTDMEKNEFRVINYVTTPNLINTCNSHLGDIRQIVGFYELPKIEQLNNKIIDGAEASNYLELSVLQELFKLLESHNLEKLINILGNNRAQYKLVEWWPVADIEPVYDSEPNAPEFKPLSFNNLKSTLHSIGRTSLSITELYVAAFWWATTKRVNLETGEYEGVVGFKYQRTDNIIYSDSKQPQEPVDEIS